MEDKQNEVLEEKETEEVDATAEEKPEDDTVAAEESTETAEPTSIEGEEAASPVEEVAEQTDSIAESDGAESVAAEEECKESVAVEKECKESVAVEEECEETAAPKETLEVSDVPEAEKFVVEESEEGTTDKKKAKGSGRKPSGRTAAEDGALAACFGAAAGFCIGLVFSAGVIGLIVGGAVAFAVGFLLHK